MRAKILDTAALGAVSPGSLVAYARARGWRRISNYGIHSDIYEAVGKPELIIPRTDRLVDYVSVVSTLIELISKSEKRDELTVYRDIAVADRDVIRVKAPDAAEDGSLRIQAGVSLVADSRDMLLAAACSARTPQPVYRAGGNKEAIDYLERVHLGQTEHGSFVLTILSPVPPSLEGTQETFWPDLMDEPYDRLVTRTLMEGLLSASKAIEESRVGEGIAAFEDAVKHGVSANLCESVARLVKSGDGIEVSVTWARTRPTPEARSTIVFTPSDAKVLEEAARSYRLKAPKIDVELVGYVHLLKREQAKVQGLVKLRAEVDGVVQSIQAVLDRSQYDQALKAHGAKEPIIIRGDLERFGQRWQLTNVSSIKAIRRAAEIDED